MRRSRLSFDRKLRAGLSSRPLTLPTAMPKLMFPSQANPGDDHSRTFQGDQNVSIDHPSHRPVHSEQTAGMPLPAMVQVATGAASDIAYTTAVWRPTSTCWTHGPPAWNLRGNRKAVPHAHLKAVLRRVDDVHSPAEVGTMALTAMQNQINPGVNHLVAKGALRCLLGQRLEHRP